MSELRLVGDFSFSRGFWCLVAAAAELFYAAVAAANKLIQRHAKVRALFQMCQHLPCHSCLWPPSLANSRARPWMAWTRHAFALQKAWRNTMVFQHSQVTVSWPFAQDYRPLELSVFLDNPALQGDTIAACVPAFDLVTNTWCLSHPLSRACAHAAARAAGEREKEGRWRYTDRGARMRQAKR